MPSAIKLFLSEKQANSFTVVHYNSWAWASITINYLQVQRDHHRLYIGQVWTRGLIVIILLYLEGRIRLGESIAFLTFLERMVGGYLYERARHKIKFFYCLTNNSSVITLLYKLYSILVRTCFFWHRPITTSTGGENERYIIVQCII